MESVDDAIGTLNSLQSLNISHNSLTSLPDGICKLKQLTSFNASFNKIRELPKNIGHLDYLEDFVNFNISKKEIKSKTNLFLNIFGRIYPIIV